MSVLDTIRTAIHSLRANPLRSILSMLGIIIGVAAVVSVVSIGTGGQQQVLANIGQLGSNLITVMPRVPRGTAGRVQQDVRSMFTVAMAEDMERLLPDVINVVPVVTTRGRLVAGASTCRRPSWG